MATIRPFKGLRPVKEKVSKIASPPYDVLSSKEAREIVKNNPISFLRIVKPEVDLPEDINLYDERVYRKARENLEHFIKQGLLIQDDVPSLYIYQQIMGNHIQTGIVACASVDEYEAGIIKKHENTREEKEIDRSKHIDTLNAQAGPVFLTYRNSSNFRIDEIIAKIAQRLPVYDFSSEDGVKHRFWIVNSPQDIEDIQNAFSNIPALYIADGHHRSAAAARVRGWRKEKNPNHTGKEEYNYFLSVIFPDNQMMIMDYNRVVKDLNGFSADEFIQNIRKNFLVEEILERYKPDSAHKFGMYLEGKWYKITAKDEIIDKNEPVKALDVYILQEYLLDPILGIKNPRKDKRISFVGGIRGIEALEKMVDTEGYTVAFAMYPTDIESLMKVADANKVMPPKSTWFEPKLRSGIVIHLL